MADVHMAPTAGRFEVRVTSDSHFSWVRTRLSLERTMMSWQRTAVALIGFGFAIVQYLEHLQQLPGARTAYLPAVPGARADRVRHPGAPHFDLAVPVVSSLPVGRTVHPDRGGEQGGKANTGHGCCHCPHPYRPLRLLCRAAPPHLAEQAEQPRPISTLDTTRPTTGDRDG